jgi:rRNA processing protein Gar1
MRSTGVSLTSTTKHVGSTAMAPTKARKSEGKGGGGVQPHGSKAIAQAAPSTCPCVALGETNTIRVHRCVVDKTTKHVGSTAMGPTKASKPEEGWGEGGGVQPHGSKAIAQAAPSTCRRVALGETNTIRVHRRVVDETTKHVGSTTMGPTKASKPERGGGEWGSISWKQSHSPSSPINLPMHSTG